MALPYGVNKGGAPEGPRDGNRKRNTLANTLSKNTVKYTNPGGAAALPPMDPASTANYYEQLAALGAQARLTSAQLRTERVGLRSAFGAERAGIVLGRKRGIADVEAQMSDRGLTGSSIAATAMTDVRADATQALQAAKSGLLQSLGQNRLQQQQAGLEFYQGAAALEAQKLAMQSTALSDQLAQNLIISGQESTMDVLKAMYEQQLRGTTPGAGKPPRLPRRPTGTGSSTTSLRDSLVGQRPRRLTIAGTGSGGTGGGAG